MRISLGGGVVLALELCKFNMDGDSVLTVIETDRLILRYLSTADQEFILALLNDPAFLRFIGDRGVRSLEDARKYITNGPMEMYARLGFGLYLVELKDDGIPIGLCGLIKRDGLNDVDIGFAFLPNYRSQGYAYEAAAATMAYGKDVINLQRIVAITSPDNEASGKLLEKLGMRFEKVIRLSEGAEEVKLFSTDDNFLLGGQ